MYRLESFQEYLSDDLGLDLTMYLSPRLSGFENSKLTRGEVWRVSVLERATFYSSIANVGILR
jgi:hypothetical protein